MSRDEMRISARLADRGSDAAVGRASSSSSNSNKVGYVCNKVIRKRKRCAGTVRRQASPLSSALSFPTALQELFIVCREIFKGPSTVPGPQDVSALCRVLDDMRPEDVGLSGDMPFFDPESTVKTTPRVSYTTIYKCDNFSLCIFFLPSGGIIPLHNHPGMTVFSKLLLGSMHVTSYDWIDPCDLSTRCIIPSSNVRPAKLKTNGIIAAPCKSSVLYPMTGGNIHEFKAMMPCAILDIMGPPYSQQDGRDCSYYRAVPNPEFPSVGQFYGDDNDGDDTEGYGWLEEIEIAEEFLMDWIEYMGPEVMGMGC